MDLAAATAPVGQVSAMLGNNLSGPIAPAAFTSIHLTNPSFGDSISRGMNYQTMIFFDELQAPFRRPLSGMISDYRNQIMSLNGYDEINDFHTKTAIDEESFFQIGISSYKSQNNERV